MINEEFQPSSKPVPPLILEDAKCMMEEFLDLIRNSKYTPLDVIISSIDEIEQIGWVFFYDDRAQWIAGNAPVIIDMNDGSFIPTGTALSTEEYVNEYILSKYPHLEGTQPETIQSVDPSLFSKRPFSD